MANFADSAWSEGIGGFGYADNDDGTVIPNPPYPQSVHIRKSFSIDDTTQIAIAAFNMDFDDGFVAWINGIEIARSNLGSIGEDPATALPFIDHEALLYQNGVPPCFVIHKEKLNECLKNGSNILAVQVSNFGSSSSDLSCLPFLSVGLKNSTTTYRPLPDWFIVPFTGFEGSHLPLILIETHGATIRSEEKVMADLRIVDNGPGNINQCDDQPNGYQGKIGIEYRGSSSMQFPKRNYGFETRTVTGTDSAVSLLGLPSESDWVLHGPFSDKSLVRNRLAYDLSAEMGHYAPRTRFCEMFIDDQYHGLYVLIEKIKRDSNRVNIARLDSNDIEGYDLTGGYIIKVDRSADGSFADGWFSKYPGLGTENTGPFFAWHYPKWEDIQPVQQNYIKNRISLFEDVLKGINYKDPYTGYRGYIDLKSFMDYFILIELSRNVDGYRLSTFLHKDRDDVDSKIHMGPVWDYDIAFGNADYYEAFQISGWNYSTMADGWGTPFWWARFLNDPYFTNNLKCRWNFLREGILSNDQINNRIDAYIDTIGTAHVRNFTQWPIHGTWVWPNHYVGNNYPEDVTYLKNWIMSRISWLDGHIPGNCTAVSNEDLENHSFLITATPNPSQDKIRLEIQNPEKLKLIMEIIDISGHQVYMENLSVESLINLEIPIKAGIYLVKTTGGLTYQTLKVVVQ